jgi:N-acyl-D-amino-acid deacylase
MASDRTRRRFLRSASVAASLGLAGCSGLPTDAGNETTTGAGTAIPSSTTVEASNDDGPDRPTTGDAVPELAPLDEAIHEFMTDRDVPAAALAVARHGDVVHERGYGWRDADRTEATRPDTPFRLASVTKALTNAAVRSLFDEGSLDPETRVFPTLDLEPLPGDEPDERLGDVTVQHLLNHAGGWDAESLFDPMFHDFVIASRMDLTHPPSARETARYMLGQPLQFTPGEREAYSNFGYALLGLLVETKTGVSLPEYVRDSVLAGANTDRLYGGASLPDDRPDDEVRYYSPHRCPNVIALDATDTVPCPDGGFHLEGLGAAGELVGTTRTLLSFSEDYLLTGEPRRRDRGSYYYFGSLSGTFTMLKQRTDGVDVAVLFNRRGPTPMSFADVADLLDAAIERIEEWP